MTKPTIDDIKKMIDDSSISREDCKELITKLNKLSINLRIESEKALIPNFKPGMNVIYGGFRAPEWEVRVKKVFKKKILVECASTNSKHLYTYRVNPSQLQIIP